MISFGKDQIIVQSSDTNSPVSFLVHSLTSLPLATETRLDMSCTAVQLKLPGHLTPAFCNYYCHLSLTLKLLNIRKFHFSYYFRCLLFFFLSSSSFSYIIPLPFFPRLAPPVTLVCPSFQIIYFLFPTLLLTPRHSVQTMSRWLKKSNTLTLPCFRPCRQRCQHADGIHQLKPTASTLPSWTLERTESKRI